MKHFYHISSTGWGRFVWQRRTLDNFPGGEVSPETNAQKPFVSPESKWKESPEAQNKTKELTEKFAQKNQVEARVALQEAFEKIVDVSVPKTQIEQWNEALELQVALSDHIQRRNQFLSSGSELVGMDLKELNEASEKYFEMSLGGPDEIVEYAESMEDEIDLARYIALYPNVEDYFQARKEAAQQILKERENRKEGQKIGSIEREIEDMSNWQ